MGNPTHRRHHPDGDGGPIRVQPSVAGGHGAPAASAPHQRRGGTGGSD
jgi:hypothetical protein